MLKLLTCLHARTKLVIVTAFQYVAPQGHIQLSPHEPRREAADHLGCPGHGGSFEERDQTVKMRQHATVKVQNRIAWQRANM